MTSVHLVALLLCFTGNTCIVLEHYVTVLSVNYASAFCMGLYVNGGFYVKFTYIIGWKYSHVILSDYASLSLSFTADSLIDNCHLLITKCRVLVLRMLLKIFAPKCILNLDHSSQNELDVLSLSMRQRLTQWFGLDFYCLFGVCWLDVSYFLALISFSHHEKLLKFSYHL